MNRSENSLGLSFPLPQIPRWSHRIFAFSSGTINLMFDPDANLPRINRTMVYLGACLIAGMRLARERQVNVRVIPTANAIEESVDLAHEIFNRVFRRVPAKIESSEVTWK